MCNAANLSAGETLTEEALYRLLDSLTQTQQYKAMVYLSVLWAEHRGKRQEGSCHG